MFNNNIGFKKKVKYTAAVIAIGVSMAYLLIGFEISAWSQATNLTEQVFTQFISVKFVPTALAKINRKYKDQWDEYTYEKFGKDGDLAVQVFRAENGTGQCDRFHTNNDKSIDVGRAQINSTHFKQFPLKDLVDCKKNLDAAYAIYSQQHGFQAWVAFSSGSYKKINLNQYLIN